MPAIEVTNLRKTFRTKRKAAGMSGSMRSLVKPEYSSVDAVRGLTFRMEPGELLGFIGPTILQIAIQSLMKEHICQTILLPPMY